jgi:leader peptidase (prepilin peptidase)/N-methyltransferase
LLGYILRRGRCRCCGTAFPARCFVVELVTALGFFGLFYLTLVVNVPELPLLRREHAAIALGQLPWQAWAVFGHQALLLSFLLAVSFIDLEHFEIPLPITVAGTLAGLVCAVLFPWPWPATPLSPEEIHRHGLGVIMLPERGLYPWPFWYPLPESFQLGGNWQTGLATGLAGALAGSVLLRSVRFVFGIGRGKEGLGVGDADLMMMGGSFLGWQPIVIAFFVSVFPALLIGVVQLVVRGRQELAFGPSLALGVLLTLLTWRWIGPEVQLLFFDGWLLGLLAVVGVFFLFLASLLIRLFRGGETNDAPVES